MERSSDTDDVRVCFFFFSRILVTVKHQSVPAACALPSRATVAVLQHHVNARAQGLREGGGD